MSQLEDLDIYDALDTIKDYDPHFFDDKNRNQSIESLYGHSKKLDDAVDSILKVRIVSDCNSYGLVFDSNPKDDALVDPIIKMASQGYHLWKIAKKLGISMTHLENMRWHYMAVNKALKPLGRDRIPDDEMVKRLIKVFEDPSKTLPDVFRIAHINRPRLMRLRMEYDDLEKAYEDYRQRREVYKHMKRIKRGHMNA